MRDNVVEPEIGGPADEVGERVDAGQRICRRRVQRKISVDARGRAPPELEAFGKKGAQDDDIEVAKVYEKAGAKISALDIATVGKWRDIARDTAWKDYGAKTATSANLLKLASDVA